MMKRILTLLCLFLSVIFFQACNKDAASRLNGTWLCDIEQTLNNMPGVEALPHNLATEMFQNMRLTIDAKQKKFTLALREPTETSSWEILSEKEGNYDIALGSQIIQIRISKNKKGVDTLCLIAPGAGQHQKLFFIKA